LDVTREVYVGCFRFSMCKTAAVAKPQIRVATLKAMCCILKNSHAPWPGRLRQSDAQLCFPGAGVKAARPLCHHWKMNILVQHSLRRLSRWMAAALLLGAFGLLPSLVAAESSRGIAVPLGGAVRADNDAIWARLVELAGGRGARFVVFATASDEPEKSAASIIATLNRVGADAEHIPVAPQIKGGDAARAARDPALVAKVKAARGIFFSGGAQERITDTLLHEGKPTPVLEAIWEVFHAGGVVAGTSAGAAIMSASMFRDPPGVLTIMQRGAGGLREGSDIDRGLGFAGANLFVDQHFLKRGRLGRLLPVMLKKGYKLGLGVEENSGAIVRGDEVEIIGEKGALLADLAEASSDQVMTAFNIKNAKLTYMERGDRYNLKTRVLTPSALKLGGKKLDPRDARYKPYFADAPFFADILGDGAIVRAMSHLIDGKPDQVLGLAFAPGAKGIENVGFEFRFSKGGDSVGYYADNEYTIANVHLDVTPVTLASPLYQRRERGRASERPTNQQK
jgi:cyanophycinase